jgi:hypothetical protein
MTVENDVLRQRFAGCFSRWSLRAFVMSCLHVTTAAAVALHYQHAGRHTELHRLRRLVPADSFWYLPFLASPRPLPLWLQMCVNWLTDLWISYESAASSAAAKTIVLWLCLDPHVRSFRAHSTWQGSTLSTHLTPRITCPRTWKRHKLTDWANACVTSYSSTETNNTR